MKAAMLTASMVAGLVFPAAAFAGEGGVFAGLDIDAGLAAGSSGTTDGGAAIAGGGVVDNVRFGSTLGVGGHIGYRFGDNPLSVFISYSHISADVSWDAAFPLFGVASRFSGEAVSNLVTGNLAYDWALSDATLIQASAGLGLSFNRLSQVAEHDEATGIFLAHLADRTHTAPAARIGAAIRHRIAPGATAGLSTSVSYMGGFRTGNTRTGNLGVTAITPYRIDDVWRVSLGASIRLEF